MHRLTIALASLALILVACNGPEGDSGVDLAATPVATRSAAPSVVPTPVPPAPTATPAPPPPTTTATPEPTPVGMAIRVVALGRSFAISGGEIVELEGAATRVTFMRVVQDSRCPTDVTCIRAGDVTLEFLIDDAAGSRTVEVSIGDRGGASVTLDALTLTLIEVEPQPLSTRTIDFLAYLATLTAVMVER